MSEAKEAPSVGDHLGNAGALPTVNFRGRKLKVGYPVESTYTKIELKIAELAYAEAVSLQKVIPGIMADMMNKVTGRYHRALGPWWNDAFNKPLNASSLILWACISDQHPEFTWEDTVQVLKESREEAKFALAIVTPPFLELVAAATPMTVAELSTGELDSL